MTHNTTLAITNHFYYGKERIFLYKERVFKTESGTQYSGIFRFVPYICYASKNIRFMLNTLDLSEISFSKQKIKL